MSSMASAKSLAIFPTTTTHSRRAVVCVSSVAFLHKSVIGALSRVAGAAEMAPLPPRPTRDRTDDDASSSTEKEDASKIEGRGGRATPSAARLQPLLEYKTRLRRAEEELKDIISRLQQQQQQQQRMMEDENEKVLGFSGTKMVSTSEANEVRKTLHENELGNFWEIALGTNQYLNGGITSSFARREADLWKLAPKKSEAIANFLTPDFNNADDKLCLIYSCVNDPSAPPSIDVLYALKLFDEGLKEAAKKGKNVTRDGLCEVAKDALVKLQTYENVVEKEANESGARDARWINPAFGKGWHSVGI
mmetsp:Transcript_9529/g.27469  ORF Transcript_9529/g.27469 Transcript_9529/m.27469 type:complete len:306 (-) Transcript_9529:82-999(-)